MDRLSVVPALGILPMRLQMPRDESSLYLQKLCHTVADLTMKMFILTFKVHLLTLQSYAILSSCVHKQLFFLHGIYNLAMYVFEFH